MKIQNKIAAILLTVMIISIQWAGAQPAELKYKVEEGAPSFFYDVITRGSGEVGKCHLRFTLKIFYDELQFVQKDSIFQAGYEVSVTVFNQLGEQADGKIVKETIEVDQYEKTNSKTLFSLTDFQMIVTPGEYDVLLSVMDLDSKKTGRRKTKIKVPDYFQEKLSMSDLLLADNVDSLDQKQIVPNVLANFGEKQTSLFVQFDIYTSKPPADVDVTYKILNFNNKVLREKKYSKTLDAAITSETIEILRGELKGGRYKLEVEIRNEKKVVSKKKDFSVRWMHMPAFAGDIQTAVEQLRYVADGGHLKKIEKAEGDEKERLFKEFWKSFDPTPGTEANELMEEYYRRVEYANSNFGVYTEGWKSDRGMVYIVLGPPSDVERRPFEINTKPYEIWFYNEFNRQFIFVDRGGFGDYRLISPFWDVINRSP